MRKLAIFVLAVALVFCIVPQSPAQELEWEQTFGGPEEEYGGPVQWTDDGGYLISATTKSYGAGNWDGWLIKTDSGGVMEWDRTYGGTGSDGCSVFQRTDDGGYILKGSTESYGAGSNDVWVIKIDSNGVTQWDRTYGGTGYDYGYLRQADDGGYFIVGATDSFGAGSNDAWLVKLNSDWVMEWQQTYGGTGDDSGYQLYSTSDGGYVILGTTESYGAGDKDVWLIKTDAGGVMEWDRTFGGPEQDRPFNAHQTDDGGYLIFARTYSYGAGGEDVWLIKTDAGGVMEWDQTIGGPERDEPWGNRQTADGGHIITGRTESYGAGMQDVWLIKIDSGGNKEWERTFGTPSQDNGYDVQQTSDGGYIIAGKYEGGDVWLIKTDANGIMEWDLTFGGPGYDRGDIVQETEDGGYMIVGLFSPPEAPWMVADVYLIKVTNPDSVRYYADHDGDNYGDPSDYRWLLGPSPPYTILVAGDCNDNDPTINPDGTEVCNDGIDNDCDTLVDAEDMDCYPGLLSINCDYPPNGSVAYFAPSFTWTAEGGINNRFAVDLSDDWTFSWYFSTYENMRQPLRESNWTMPQRIWNKVPSYTATYWRVRGVDLRTDPSRIVTCDELRWFYKY